jgi:hypothetical protein
LQPNAPPPSTQSTTATAPQKERDKKVRVVRKAQGKAKTHKESRIKAVSGAARSKKSQKRIDHRARMLAAEPAAPAAGGGNEAMGDAAAAAAGAAAAAAGKKARRRRAPKKAARGGGAAAAATTAAAAAAGGGGEGMQE